MHRIYLDYAASHPLIPEARQVINDFIKDNPVGNPSSLHTEGRAMQAHLDKAHTTLAAVFGVHPTEVIFTSGATEANALAICGGLNAWRQEHPGERPHIIMSAIEHPSWRAMAKSEEADITLAPVSPDGVVKNSDIIEAIQPNTALIGCMYVNNEIGTVQPVEAIGKTLQERRAQHPKEPHTPWPLFHVDATQAFPYLNTHLGHIRADMVTISGHKYGALAGIGALLVKKPTRLQSLLKGGAQEWGYRAGTENVLGALTMAQTIEWGDANRDALTRHAQELQSTLETAMAQELPHLTILGSAVNRSAHITYLWLPGVIDEHIVHRLDLEGIAVSSGSACSSGALLPSSILLAMGYDEQAAFGGLRVSYGRFTTTSEIGEFVAKLKSIVATRRA